MNTTIAGPHSARATRAIWTRVVLLEKAASDLMEGNES